MPRNLPCPPARRLPWAAACLSLALLAAPAALAQPASGGREIAPTGATVPGAGRPPGSETTAREWVQQQQREEDATRAAERDREQLRDLNAISRQLAPGATPPAPQVEPRR